MNSKIIIWVLISGCVYCEHIYDFITPCKRSDPQFDKCLEESMNKIFSHLSNPIDELDTLSLDPMRVSKVDVAIAIPPVKLVLENATVYGLSKVHVSELKSDMKNLIFTFRLTFPLIEANAQYKFEVDVLNAPIKDQGQAALNATHIMCNVTLITNSVMIKKQHILQVTNLHFEVYSTFEYNVVLASSENTGLVQTVNTILNRETQFINQIVIPLIQTEAPPIIRNITNNIFRRVPMEYLISD